MFFAQLHHIDVSFCQKDWERIAKSWQNQCNVHPQLHFQLLQQHLQYLAIPKLFAK